MSVGKKFFISFIPLLLYLGGCFVYLLNGVFAEKIEWLFWVLTVLAVIGGITFFALSIIEASLAIISRYSGVMYNRTEEKGTVINKLISSIMFFVLLLVTIIAYVVATGVPD